MNSLVQIFANLKNPTKFGLTIGKVLTPLPEITIDIGNGVILDKDDLLFTASVLKDYEREFEITSTDVQIKGDKLNTKGTKLDIDGVDWSLQALPFVLSDTLVAGANPPTRPVLMLPESVATKFSFKGTKADAENDDFDLNGTDFKATGTIKWTNELKADDMVVLIASESSQQFVVLEKVLSFK